MVVNKESFANPEKRKAMDQLMTLLNGALEARGKVLLKHRRIHPVLAPAIADRHVFCTKQPGLHGCVNRGHATADNHDPSADGNVRLVCRLPQTGDEIHSIHNTVCVSPIHLQDVYTCQSYS